MDRRLRAEHGRRAFVLHPVLARAAVVDCHLDSRPGIWRGCRAGPDFRRTARHDGPGGGTRRGRPSCQRQRASPGYRCHGDWDCDSADRRHIGVRRVAGRPGPHMACACTRAFARSVGLAAQPPAVVWNDSGHCFPAHGVARTGRRDSGFGKVVGWRVRGLGSAGPGRQPVDRFSPHDHGVRDDLQADAAREGALARRMAGRRGDLAAFHRGQVHHRCVYRQKRHRVGVRRRRLAGDHPDLGLLLGPDIPDWRRVHLGLRQYI